MAPIAKPEILSDYQKVAHFKLDSTTYEIQVFKQGSDDSVVKFEKGIIQLTNTSIEDESISIRLCKKTPSGERIYYQLVLNSASQKDQDDIVKAIEAGYQNESGSTLPEVSKAMEAIFRDGKVKAGNEIKASFFTQARRAMLP